jgi:hypothetical protein
VKLLTLESSPSKSQLTKRQLKQFAEVIAGGAEALANWWTDHPKARREELVSVLAAFVRQGLGSAPQARPAARTRRRKSA